MRKARYEGKRPWALGPAEGLSKPYHFVPGQLISIDDEDLKAINKMLGPGRKLAQLEQVQERANTGEKRPQQTARKQH